MTTIATDERVLEQLMERFGRQNLPAQLLPLERLRSAITRRGGTELVSYLMGLSDQAFEQLCKEETELIGERGPMAGASIAPP